MKRSREVVIISVLASAIAADYLVTNDDSEPPSYSSDPPSYSSRPKANTIIGPETDSLNLRPEAIKIGQLILKDGRRTIAHNPDGTFTVKISRQHPSHTTPNGYASNDQIDTVVATMRKVNSQLDPNTTTMVGLEEVGCLDGDICKERAHPSVTSLERIGAGAWVVRDSGLAPDGANPEDYTELADRVYQVADDIVISD